jgi:drug/metabolite transporter (DMT)-like permease
LIPPLTLSIAWVWLAEIPTALSAIGTVIVLAALLVVHFKASASN